MNRDNTNKTFFSNQLKDILGKTKSSINKDNKNNAYHTNIGEKDDLKKDFDNFFNEYPDQVRLPYASLTKIIFESDIDLNIIDELIVSLREILDTSENPRAVGIPEKFIEHIELAYTQKTSLYERQKSEINSLSEETKGLKKEIENYENKMKEVESKFYSELIGILGIFSALMFGMISGFNALIESINALSSTSQNIGRIGMGITIIAMGLIIFLYALIYWISKLSGNKLINKSEVTKNKFQKTLSHHSMLILSLLTLSILFFVSTFIHVLSRGGIIEKILNNNFNLSEIGDLWWIITPILILLIIAITSVILWIFQSQEKK